MQVLNRLPTWALPLFVFFTAFAVRLGVIVHWGFDGLYGQDAFAYFDQCAAIAERLVAGWAPMPAFFWPSGYPILGALSLLVTGGAPAAPQLVNVILGSLLASLLAVFAREVGRAVTDDIGGEVSALIAGLATALSGQMVLSSVVVMSDTATALLLALAALSIQRLARDPRRWGWLPLAAAAITAALVTRRAALLAVPAFAVAALLASWRIRRPVAAAGLALTAAAVIAAPELFVFTADDSVTGYLAGWEPLNAFSRTFNVAGDIRIYRFPNWLFYTGSFWHPGLLPPFIGVLAAFGAIVLWRRERPTLVLLGGWILTATVFLVGLPFQNLRFNVTQWPPAVLFAALGTAIMWRHRQRLTILLVIAALATAGIFNPWWLNRFMDRAGEARTVAMRVDQLLPDGGQVLAFDITGAVDHYTDAEVFELFSLDPAALARTCAGAEPTLLVIDEADIRARWTEHLPFEHLEWLERERSLEPVEQIGRWSLIRVHPAPAAGRDSG